ncbi:MAG: hypothetical protein L0Y43_03730 [Methylococcaceae bacterium]|nr:hypothetical protein [Methylococcaceae bacterium]
MYRVQPLAPLFTIACLGLILMVWRKAPAIEYFNAPWMLYSGLGCIAISLMTASFRRDSIPLSYDLFCVGSLCIWFVLWRAVYRIDAPVFAWYPIFFVLLILLLNRQVIYKRDLMDPVQLKMIRLMVGSRIFHPMLLTTGVLLSVYFSEYYIFYPIVLSLVFVRCSFGIVLRESGKS